MDRVSQEPSALSEFDRDLAARIRWWRERAGLKGIELAAACDVTPSAVSRWEGGSAAPAQKMLAAIAAACGVDLTTFWAADLTDQPAAE